MGICPDSKVRGANMGPIWGRQDPDWPHVGPMNFAIWVRLLILPLYYENLWDIVQSPLYYGIAEETQGDCVEGFATATSPLNRGKKHSGIWNCMKSWNLNGSQVATELN